MPKLNSRRALTARGAIIGFLKPVLAADAAFEPATALVGVDAQNFRKRIPAIIEAVKRGTRGLLAYDADQDELRGLLESLADQNDDHDQVEVNPANPGQNDRPVSLDEFLAGKLSPKDQEKATSLIGDARLRRQRLGRAAKDQDMSQVEELLDYLARCGLDNAQLKQAAELFLREDGAAEDEPPPFPGRPRPGGQMDPISQDAKLLAHDARSRVAADAAASFSQRFPRASAIRTLPGDLYAPRTAPVSAAAEREFATRFPAASKIRILS